MKLDFDLALLCCFGVVDCSLSEIVKRGDGTYRATVVGDTSFLSEAEDSRTARYN